MLKYFIFINFFSFIIFGMDKLFAKKHFRRISEKTLIINSFIGGCVGTIMGMMIFHHKTRKIKFKLLVPLSLVLWVLVFFLLICYYS